MNKLILLFAFFASALVLNAQDPNIVWQKTIGGDDWDSATFIISTTDQGYLVGGSSKSNISGEKTEDSRGGYDFWVLKLDSTGNIEWQRTLGGDQDDNLRDGKQTIDGGFILVGTSDSGISGDKTENSRGGSDYWVIKLTSIGNIEWQKTIGGDKTDTVLGIELTIDGGYLIGGTSYSSISGDRTVYNFRSDAWIIKLDEDGNILWQRGHQLVNNEVVSSFKVTEDDGYIIGARDMDYYIFLRIKPTGGYLWEKYYGASGWNNLSDVAPTSDGGVIGFGFSDSDISGDKTEVSRGLTDYWLLKLDVNGDIEWQRTIGGSEGEEATQVIQTPDGGYFITGRSESNISGEKIQNVVGSFDFWILKLNSVGIIEWQNNLGGMQMEFSPKAIINIDGSFTIAGTSASDISGDKTENSRGGRDFWIIKHAATLSVEDNPFAKAISLYPNPAKNILQIDTQEQSITQINIYSLTGSRLMQLDMNSISPTVDVSELASGVYFIQLYSGKNVTLKKFVKE